MSAPDWARKASRLANVSRVKQREAAGQLRAASPDEIVVQCLRCRHIGRLTALDLSRRGIAAGAPIASFVKRLRCRKCGSQSVRAKRLAQCRAG